ncbi:MAG: NADH-quinone oxidoreductase subunit J [Sphingobacteriales bacterium]|jgi:NADH-quinone oxidoreductase subunit J
MSGASIVFYLLALMTVGSAWLSVTSRQIFRSAIYLLFTLIGIAGLYFWMNNPFIAAVQIVVYVGGIAVLIIFSIFLTQQAGEKLPAVPGGKVFISLLAAGSGLALILSLILRYRFAITNATEAPGVEKIGEKMLDINGYALPFELVSMLLLAAMIGCIVIALTSKVETK